MKQDILCSTCPMIIIAHFSLKKKKKAHFSCIVLTFSYHFFLKKSLFLYLFFWSNPSWSSKTLMLENLLGTKLMSVNHISYCKFNRELDVRVDWSLTLSICGFISGKNERKSLWIKKKKKRKRKKIRSNQLKETINSAYIFTIKLATLELLMH